MISFSQLMEKVTSSAYFANKESKQRRKNINVQSRYAQKAIEYSRKRSIEVSQQAHKDRLDRMKRKPPKQYVQSKLRKTYAQIKRAAGINMSPLWKPKSIISTRSRKPSGLLGTKRIV